MSRVVVGVWSFGLMLVLAGCAHDDAPEPGAPESGAEPSATTSSTASPRDSTIGEAASLPPTYARDSSLARDPECHFDADCDDEQMCDHGVCMQWWRMKGEVPEVAPEDLYWQVQRGEVQVVDVRTAAEFRLGRIEGAMHVPIQTLPARLDDLPLDKDKPVVAICLTAHRSIAAVRLLSRHGYDVVQLQGGMTAWARSKLPVIRGRDVDVTQ